MVVISVVLNGEDMFVSSVPKISAEQMANALLTAHGKTALVATGAAAQPQPTPEQLAAIEAARAQSEESTPSTESTDPETDDA